MPTGRLISQNIGGVSHFVADLGVVIKDAIAALRARRLHARRRASITNHQRVAGQHLNNVCIYTPFFFDGELQAFAIVRAHWVDVGGMSTGFGAASLGQRSVDGRAAARPDQDLRSAASPTRSCCAMIARQHPLPECVDGRPALADGGLQAGRAPARRAVRALRARRRSAPRSSASSTRPKRSAGCVVARHPRRRLRGRVVSSTTTARTARLDRPDPRAGHRQRQTT